MNLIMRGILPDNIVTRNGDTLEDDWPYFDDSDRVNTYEPLFVDAVVSNPPYSQAWNPADKQSDPRFAAFGVAPKGKADYAFLLHDLFHLKRDGIMTIVLPHGVLFRGGEEGTIRKNLIEQNHIDAIIGLPANIFFGTGIPTIIMVLKKARPDTDVLIVDASKGFAKVGKNNQLRACDIKHITDVVTARKTEDKFSRLVSREEIRRNEYNLNIPRYVDSSEPAESWDIYATMFGGIPESELAGLQAYWQAFPNLKSALFVPENAQYWQINTKDLREAVHNHPDVVAFSKRYKAAFADFGPKLKVRLIDNAQTVSLPQEEAALSDDIFARLAGLPLVDQYAAYQLLHEDWEKISVDLEVMQTEGPAAVRQVDPHYVMKKKDGRDQEVQEGYQGHILPFELVQQTLMADALAALHAKEARVSEIDAALQELLEQLPEEEKDKPFVNEEKDAFVPAEIKKTLKAKDAEVETLAVLRQADALIAEGKTVKKKIKEDTAQLHLATKARIEALTDDEVTELLQRKWIDPLTKSLNQLPESVIDTLVTKLETLNKKYETTLDDVERKIHDEERTLMGMLNQLCASEFDRKGLDAFKALLGGETI